MKRRILAALLIFCMCMTAPSWGGMTVMAAEEPGVVYDGQTVSGTYTISTAAQLKTLAEKVNESTSYAGTTFKLTEDIDLSEAGYGESNPWTPIGTAESKSFSGMFDGAGHTISGLSINTDAEDYQGLFGYINKAKIQNFTVQGTVNAVSTQRIYVGGIVGYNSGGTVTNCRNEGTANVAGKRIYVGGIVGFNSRGTVTNCRNENTINISDGTSGSSFVGGIVGQDYVGTVTNCRNHGKVMNTKQIAYAGGIVGGNHDAPEATTIENCWNEGAVTGYHAGGIMGQAYSSTSTTIENCWNEGAVTGDNAGGIVGYNQGKEIITNCGNQGAVTGDNAGEIVGRNNLYSGNTTVTNCYYLDTTANEDVGDGTVEGTAEVKTSTEFASGEVTWLLQGGQDAPNDSDDQDDQDDQDGLVWAQQLGVDPFPRLACFMEEDEEAKETKRVLKVGFYNAANDTDYTPYGDKPYINKGATVQEAGGAEPDSQEYPAESYEAVWLDSSELTGTDYSGKIFGKDTPIEKDTEFYLFYKELFSGENTALTASSGTAETKDLDECMKYAGSGDAAGNFTYEITAGNDTLGATVADNELTIPSTAAAGSYELTIKATEKQMKLANLIGTATSAGTDYDTFTVSVTVEKSAEELVEQAKEVVKKALDELNVTNETTKEDVQNAVDQALEKAGLGDVTATVGDDFTVKKATEESEGQITGTVALEKGKETDSVGIDKKIDKLEQTPDSNDAKRLEAAKKVVQNVLDGMSATNDMTQKKIQELIDEALKAVGFDDVTAKVEDDFTIEEATGNTKGKITGTVTLKKGEAKSSVKFDLEIPEDKSKGTVDKETQSGEGAPEAELPMEKEEMADAVFTEEEWREIEEGKDIKLLLTVDNIEEEKVSMEEVQKIEKGASYYTVGQYLDINLLKTVSTNGVKEGEPTRITNTGKPIRVVIYIPDSLKEDGRTYAVVRLHDGETTLLEDLDTDPDTITIETNRFSTYAMVYTELTDADRVTGAEEKLKEILKGLTATNDTTKEDLEKQIHDALEKEGYGDITVTVEITERENATTEKEGKIQGTVTVSKGNASGQKMLMEVVIGKVTETRPSATPGVTPTATPEVSPSATPGASPSAVPGVSPSATPGITPTATPSAGTISPEQREKNSISLNAKLKVDQKGKKINVGWGKVKGADGYMVYIQYCSKKFSAKPTKTVKSSSAAKVTVTKVNGKKLSLKKNYKVYVVAYKLVNGRKVLLGKTITAHVVGKNNKVYTNVKKVKVSKKKYTLKAGKTAKIKAKTVLVAKKKKHLSNAHAKKFRYRSTDTGVAVVSKKGKITAKGKGTCIIYVYARNGYAKKVKVTVK